MAIDLKTIGLTLVALVAFASNSLLTRLALGAREIDAATFVALRLGAGAAVLTLIVRAKAGNWMFLRGRSTSGPLALLVYAVGFSFAYLRIGAAIGALVLFGAVQLTMIGYGVFRGERPAPLAWLGLALAVAGLASLTLPSATQPDPLGLLLMLVAGVAWAIYSLVGRTTSDPLAANARSFLWSSVPALLVVCASRASLVLGSRGIALALVSGALTSGLGYAVWYRALPRLSITRAAVAQLSVPVIAAIGATVVLDEELSVRLVMAATAVLSGVGLVLAARSRVRA